MAKLTTAEMIEAIKELSVLELNELVKACEEEFGVFLELIGGILGRINVVSIIQHPQMGPIQGQVTAVPILLLYTATLISEIRSGWPNLNSILTPLANSRVYGIVTQHIPMV